MTAAVVAGTAFGDGYLDGLHNRDTSAHLHTEGRALEKYLAGVACGHQDRTDGALDPAERYAP